MFSFKGKSKDLEQVAARAQAEAAWARLAENYAQQESTSDGALEAYLAYIQDRAPESIDGKIAALLEAACRVDENHVSDDRQRAAALAKRVIAANGALEWPYYHLAVAYLQDGDLPAAMINLVRAQKRNPNRAMTYYWMGACHLRQAMAAAPTAAMEWFSKFLAFPPENPEVAELQSTVALEIAKRLSGRAEAMPHLEMAVARARAAIGLGGRHPAIVQILIESLYRQERFSDIATEWESGPIPETDAKTRLLVGRSYLQLGRFEAALDCYRKVPPEPYVNYYAACAQANLGRLGDAKLRFQGLAAAGGELAARAWTQLAIIFLREGDVGAAGDAYDHAMVLDPSDVSPLYGMGSLAFSMGELGVAGEYFEKTLRQDPSAIRARFAMGVVHERRGETNGAIADYEAAGASMDVRIRLGVLYCRAREFEKAVRLLEPLRGSGVENDAVLYYLGLAYAGVERYEQAVEIWSRLLERHSPDRELERGLAVLYLGQALRKWESCESEALLDQALAHDPNNARCQYFRALYDWKRGRVKEAEDRLRELPNRGGDSRVLYRELEQRSASLTKTHGGNASTAQLFEDLYSDLELDLAEAREIQPDELKRYDDLASVDLTPEFDR